MTRKLTLFVLLRRKTKAMTATMATMAGTNHPAAEAEADHRAEAADQAEADHRVAVGEGQAEVEVAAEVRAATAAVDLQVGVVHRVAGVKVKAADPAAVEMKAVVEVDHREAEAVEDPAEVEAAEVVHPAAALKVKAAVKSRGLQLQLLV